ncbi:MAG: MFS transporter [Neomegalonema sp.]|nr:MFS transporter [Neomegalonema sp.]
MSTISSQRDARPLSIGVLAALSAPQVPLAALYFPVFVYLAPFYAKERGLDLAAIGAVFVFARLVDAISDPLVGWASDRWRTRFGRRKLWLALSTPLVCISVWMAMAPPPEVSLGYVALWITALTLSWTLALTPYFAWSLETSTDYSGRARVSTWRETGFLLGTFAAAALYANYDGGEHGLYAIAVAVVLTMPLCAVAALLFAPEPKDRSRKTAAPLDWRAGVRAMRANGPFLRLMACHAINSAANALPAALFLLFATSVLGAGDGGAGLLLTLYFVAAIVAAPFWNWASRRWSKHRVWATALAFNALAFWPALTLGDGDLVAFAVISLLTGLAFSADVILPPAILADVVDVDTAETGRQRTGVYMAVWLVVLKAASAFAAGGGLIALDLVGFDATAKENDASALLALALLYAGLPVALKLISVGLIWTFPLDAAAQLDLRRQIEDRDQREAAAP